MARQKTAITEELVPVETLAADAGMPAWERAALMRAAGWAPGKQIARSAFDDARAAFNRRPQGGGTIGR